ncbi:hypothetical protein SY88_11720 [Clostridiales bacterium PH28_bin88]|nr:hypothetical protein SY88_11720 [Clostridiales bacterium PH28_bin88]
MPRIHDDEQAAEYWETHSTAPYWNQLEPVDFEMEGERPTTTRINIRVNSKHLNQIKKIAEGKGIPYQTMIKMWLAEKIKQER